VADTPTTQKDKTMKTVWVLTNGDLNDYDAPAPGAIFATEREAWEHVSKSLWFNVYNDGRVYACVDYTYLYEMPFGVDIDMNDVPVTLIPSWGDISGEMGRYWQPE